MRGRSFVAITQRSAKHRAFRHCEEAKADEAIQSPASGSGLLRFARNDEEIAKRLD
jgi:hypothetical protein